MNYSQVICPKVTNTGGATTRGIVEAPWGLAAQWRFSDMDFTLDHTWDCDSLMVLSILHYW